jgi:AhpD family alkylhydroperoxidase
MEMFAGQSFRPCYRHSANEPACDKLYRRCNLQRVLERLTGMDEFDRYRAEMNEKLLGSGHLGIKRFFALDTQAYEDGALDKKTKELMGLTASIVLRCDDCITYHIKQCATAGVTREQFMDAFNVALVVGGSITIPHLRRATDKLDQILLGTY